MAAENQVKNVLKKDKYSRAREGKSSFFDIFCGACGTHVALYQKDGPGTWVRMYFDRFYAPKELANLSPDPLDKSGPQSLSCPKCKARIGTRMIFKAENRLAFRLFRGSFTKKQSDGTYPPNN